MAMGRPPDYREEFCEAVHKALMDGWTRTAAAAMIGISRETFYAWQRTHPDFSDAVARGEAGLSLFWEGEHRNAESNVDIARTQFMLKNVARSEFADRQELTGKDGGPLQVDTNARVSIEGLDAAGLAELYRAKIHGAGEGGGRP